MVYKYLTTAIGTNPMLFAGRFYAHHPAVAFGHWPPLFYILQACWGLLFALSRTSALILIASLSSLIITILCCAIGPRFGRLYSPSLLPFFDLAYSSAAHV